MRVFQYQGGSIVRNPPRLSIRTIAVLALALAIAATTVTAPVRAGETPVDDLEDVRATVIDAVNWKINSLNGMKAETSNPDKIGIYADGIAELTNLRDTRIVSEDNIPELWGLKEQAYGIYESTVAAANDVANTPAEELAIAKDKAASTIELKIKLLRKWVKGVDNPNAATIVESGIAQLDALRDKLEGVTNPEGAWAIKDQAKAIYYDTIERAESATNEPTEEEKAAAALEKARKNTLHLIEGKTAILNAAADAARIPAVIEVFEEAAQEIEDLTEPARTAKTTGALNKIEDQVGSIYEAAKAAVADILGDRDENDDDATDAIESHLKRTLDYVNALTDRAEWSAGESPETWNALMAAQDNVVAAVKKVNDVIGSGADLDVRWIQLSDAMRDFRRALIAHYVALRSQPMFVGGLHIAG